MARLDPSKIRRSTPDKGRQEQRPRPSREERRPRTARRERRREQLTQRRGGGPIRLDPTRLGQNRGQRRPGAVPRRDERPRRGEEGRRDGDGVRERRPEAPTRPETPALERVMFDLGGGRTMSVAASDIAPGAAEAWQKAQVSKIKPPPTGDQAERTFKPKKPEDKKPYESDIPEPGVPVEEYGVWESITDRVGRKYEKAQESVEKAGKGGYREVAADDNLKTIGGWFGAVGDVFHNIGQVPTVGKAATALGSSAMLVLSTPAEATEQIIGNAIGAAGWKQEFGVQTAADEQAFQVATRLTYSGKDAMKNAYEEARALANNGQLTEDIAEEIQGKHGVWWRELVGQVVLDPLNILSIPGKGAAQAKRAAQAEAALVKPLTTADGALVKTSEVVQRLSQSATRQGQIAEETKWINKAKSFVNPRTKATIIHREAESTAQLAGRMTWVVEDVVRGQADDLIRQGGLNVAKGTPEYEKVVSTMVNQKVSETAADWVRLASDDVAEVEQAASKLAPVFGTIPTSEQGRKTAVVMRRMAERADGEIGDFMSIMQATKAEGKTVEHVVHAFYEKATRLLDDMIEKPKFEKNILFSAPSKHLAWGPRKAMDNLFSKMYLGTFGWASRNLQYNVVGMGVNHWSPFFKPNANMVKKFGLKGIAGRERAVTEVGEGFSLLFPGHWLGNKIEQWNSMQIVDQAYVDVLRRMGSRGLDSIQFPPNMSPQAIRAVKQAFKKALHEGPEGLDKLEAIIKRVSGAAGDVPPSGTTGALDLMPWRNISEGMTEQLQASKSGAWEEVSRILSDAATPEDAIAQLDNLIDTMAQRMVDTAMGAKPMGPVVGSATGDLVQQTLHFADISDVKSTEDLIKSVSDIEEYIRRARNLAYANAARSKRSTDWMRFLDRAETEYRAAIEGIRQEQVLLYALVRNGALSEADYTQRVFVRYAQAKNSLDNVYAQVTSEAASFTAKPSELLPLAEVQRPLLEEALGQAAHSAGYPGWVTKRGGKVVDDAQEVENLRYTAYRQANEFDIVPDVHFRNKLRQVLGREDFSNIKELSDDEVLTLVNYFREIDGAPPVNIDQLYGDYQTAWVRLGDELPEATAHLDDLPDALTQLSKGLDLRGVDEAGQAAYYIEPSTGEKVYAFMDDVTGEISKDDFVRYVDDLIRGLDAADDEGRLALVTVQQMVAGGLPKLGPGAAPADAVYHGGDELIRMIKSLQSQIKGTAALPPPAITELPTGAADELINALRGRYAEVHTMAGDVATRARDFALLDYKDRRFFDPLIKTFYPWGYWHTRTLPNFAVAIAKNPAYAAHYLHYKRELREYNDNDPSVPEWAKDHVILRPPGYDGMLMWDVEAGFNAFGSLFESFDDPDKEKDAFGQFVQTMNRLGPGIHPMLGMAYAAERSLLSGDDEAARSLGFLSPQTRAITAATGVTLEPWLWNRDPRTRERIPFSGGTKWDISKATRYIAHQQATGDIRSEEAILAAATREGKVFDNAMQAIAEYRRLPVLASVFFGLRMTPQKEWEQELVAKTGEWAEMRQTDPKAANNILAENPHLGVAWMSKDNEAHRIGSLAKNVFSRFPPGMTRQQKNEIIARSGMVPQMIEAFDWSEPDGGISQWDPSDYENFVNGIISVAEVIGAPDVETAKEWREVRQVKKQLEAEYDQNFPQAREQTTTYFQIREAEGKDAANEYAAQSGLFDAWGWKNQQMTENDLLLKYYAEPADVDQAAETLAHEAMERRWPGIRETQDAYYSIPEDDYRARRQFRIDHPELRQYWQTKDKVVGDYIKQLESARMQASTGAQTPATIDYIIEGQPTFAQQNILDSVAAMELSEERRLGEQLPPTIEPGRFSPQELAAFEAKDNAYAKVYQNYPDMVQQERVYDNIKATRGDDDAKLYATKVGLWEKWDYAKVAQAESPALLATQTPEQLEKTAKAFARFEADKRWPGIRDVLNMYYATSNKSAKKQIRNRHPEIKQYWDTQDRREAGHYRRLLEQQHRARRQFGATPVNYNQ